MLPSIVEFGWSSIVYLTIAFIIYKGIWHFVVNKRNRIKSKSLVPLGALGLIVSIVDYFNKLRLAFDAIAAAGDISPALVASAIRDAQSAPILGLVCLATSYIFKYLNQ